MDSDEQGKRRSRVGRCTNLLESFPCSVAMLWVGFRNSRKFFSPPPPDPPPVTKHCCVNVYLPLGHCFVWMWAVWHTMALGLTQPLTELNIRKCFWRVERCRRVRLTTSPPSVSRLSRLDNVGSSTSHIFIRLHGLLRG
jgi:hypothetical protein